MKIGPECIPCIMRQALETGKIATDDLNKQGKDLKHAADLLSDIDFNNIPLAVSHKYQRIVRKITGVCDLTKIWRRNPIEKLWKCTQS